MSVSLSLSYFGNDKQQQAQKEPRCQQQRREEGKMQALIFEIMLAAPKSVISKQLRGWRGPVGSFRKNPVTSFLYVTMTSQYGRHAGKCDHVFYETSCFSSSYVSPKTCLIFDEFCGTIPYTHRGYVPYHTTPYFVLMAFHQLFCVSLRDDGSTSRQKCFLTTTFSPSGGS